MQWNAFLRFLKFFLRRLIADLSRMRSGLETRPVHVRSVLERVALGQVFLPVIRFSPHSTKSTLISILALPGQAGEAKGPFKQSNALSDMGEALDKEKKYVHGLFRLQSVTMRGTVPPIFHKPRDVTCWNAVNFSDDYRYISTARAVDSTPLCLCELP